MTRLAPLHLDIPESDEPTLAPDLDGAQSLLTLQHGRPNFIAGGVAIAIYAMILGGLLTFTSKPIHAPPEAPMELVMLPPPPPPVIEEAKPPEAAKPPEPEPEPQIQAQPKPEELPPPPPPAAVEPPVAPVAPPPPPPPPKPTIVEKPKVPPKPKPTVVHKPKPKPAAPRRVAAARTDVASTHQAEPRAGATALAIANQIHARLARAAADAYPESQKPRSARVGYRVQIDAGGHVTSFSIKPSGNPAFDAAASRLGGRIGSVDPPGRPAALSGSITFAYR